LEVIMEIKNYKKRIVDEQVCEYLKLFGAICIEGPKYCGKTWVGRYHSNSEALLYVKTGEKSNQVELAKISPEIILEGEKPKLIDEWQEATNLWDEIRYDVDKTGLKGQYILTGSSTPNRNGISHSGAGRFGKIQSMLSGLTTLKVYPGNFNNPELSFSYSQETESNQLYQVISIALNKVLLLSLKYSLKFVLLRFQKDLITHA